MTIDAEFIPIHTRGVKVAISVPDAVCQAADEMAAQMGVSRSQFFATAARRYLDELDARSLTGRIDEALERIGSTDESTSEAVTAGQRLLVAADDEW